MHIASYRRVSEWELEVISRGLYRGESFARIARDLGRTTSTVSRLVHIEGGRRRFRACIAAPHVAHRAAQRRIGKGRLCSDPHLRRYVEEKLLLYWSPEEIAQRLVKEYPQDVRMRIAPETIYEYIYVLPRGELRRSLIRALRHEHKYRRTRRKGPKRIETRGKIADMLSIEERPKEVADRIIPGHWEGDLIVGKHRGSALGTLVERTTRTTMLVHLAQKDVASVRVAYTERIRKLPTHLAKSLTCDQGKEMSEHKRLSIDTGMTVYFAHPASPWERGTNENTNGLIRQFFPKGTDFNTVSAHEIQRVEDLLNGRPRKVLDWKTPHEALQELLR